MKTVMRIATLGLTLALLAALAPRAEAANKYWNPTSGNGWNTGANWSPSGVPASADVAIFDGNTNSADCEIDANVTVAGIVITNAYGGTITQGAGRTISINGAAGYQQHSGTFAGGGGDISINGAPVGFALLGGTFTSTPGTLQIARGTQSAWTAFLRGGGNFEHNNGTVKILAYGRVDTRMDGGAATTTFNNLAIDREYWDDSIRIVVTNTFVVAGTLSYASGNGPVALNGGVIEMKGSNIVLGTRGGGGSAWLKLLGDGNQTITALGGMLPNVLVDKTNGTVSIVGSSNAAVQSLVLTNGTFVSTTNTLSVWGGFTRYEGATFVHNDGTVKIIPAGRATTYMNVPTEETFRHFQIGQTGWGDGTVLDLSGDRLNVLGNLAFDNGNPVEMRNGAFDVRGDVTIRGCSGGGTAALTLSGTNQQIVTRTAGTPPGATWTLDKSGGSVTLATDLSLSRSDQDLVWTNGALNLSSNTLTVADDMTIYPGATKLLVTVADATKAGRLTVGDLASGIANVALEIAITASAEQMAGQTYTILSNSSVLTTQFESVTWPSGWKGVVSYSANSGKNVTLSGIRRVAAGTLILLR